MTAAATAAVYRTGNVGAFPVLIFNQSVPVTYFLLLILLFNHH